VPPALYALATVYVRRMEGWGQWAAAPIFVPVLILSATVGAVGATHLALSWLRERRFDRVLFAGTLLGSSVALYFCARALTR